MNKVMTEEEFIKESKRIIEGGTDEEQFNFAIGQTVALCNNLELCPHCLASALLEIWKQQEKNHNKELH